MPEAPNKLTNALRQFLREFEADPEADRRYPTGAWALGHEVRIPDVKLPPPYMVFLTLCRLMGYKYFGPEEKVAWGIPILFRGAPFLLAHRKFGFMLSTPQPQPAAAEMALALLQQLSKAVRVADRLIKPITKEKIQEGNVTVINNHALLDRMYRFFREKAQEAFSPGPEDISGGSSMPGGPAFASSAHQGKARRSREGPYYASAMLDPFYSRLEHLLILLLPFVDYDRSKDNLVDLMSSNWGDKFKRLFDISVDATAKSIYDRLRNIKEEYRNTLSHGTFEKSGESLHFHLPVVGSIPVRLLERAGKLRFSSMPIHHATFGEICALFDETDEFLRGGKTKYGMKFVEEGFDVPFDEQSIARYRAAMTSDEDFEELIEYENYIVDMYRNMDW